jgi:Uma2 family endonuclease
MNTAAAEPRLLTADELLHLPYNGLRHELLRGELRTRTPASSEHGRIVFHLTGRLWDFLEANPLGEAFGAETGFRLGSDPDSVALGTCAPPYFGLRTRYLLFRTVVTRSD